jgi:hypothetical protein
MEPPQNPPVLRNLLLTRGYLKNAGIEAAQTNCDNLTGAARDFCYSGYPRSSAGSSSSSSSGRGAGSGSGSGRH